MWINLHYYNKEKAGLFIWNEPSLHKSEHISPPKKRGVYFWVTVVFAIIIAMGALSFIVGDIHTGSTEVTPQVTTQITTQITTQVTTVPTLSPPTDGVTWTNMTLDAKWTPRAGQSSVVTPDGSIVLMGGENNNPITYHSDVWQSIDDGVTWTQINPSAGWSPRSGQSSVVMPDGSIVLMGGYGTVMHNDVWRSTNNGATWMEMTPDAEWSPRSGQSSVVMPDGSIVLMGGEDFNGNFTNDVWRSIDDGASWTRMNASAGWPARWEQSSVVMPDNSIVLMGGQDIHGFTNDVWRSIDDGVTWTQINPSAGWSKRSAFSSVAMPDGSIVLMGGYDKENNEVVNDVWRSTNNGATWMEMTPDAEWSPRASQSSVVMPDNSIVLIGGVGNTGNCYSDVWRSILTGS
jgi:hypothetical protein